MLRAAYRSRVDYVGNWLPEPVHAVIESEAEAQMGGWTKSCGALSGAAGSAKNHSHSIVPGGLLVTS